MSEQTVGRRIKARRTELKLTLEEVAKLIGSGKSYVWELENKNIARPSAEKLLKLAEALQTSMSYLLGTEENFPKEDLRDKFATAAMQGMLSRDSYQGGWCPSSDESKKPCGIKRVAKFAYEYADAMLEARKNCTTTLTTNED